MGDGPQRLGGVRALLESIYPGAQAELGSATRGTATRPAPGRAMTEGGRVFRVLPSRNRPRLLVPADLPGAAGPALERVSAIDRRRDVMVRRAVAAVAASPLGSRLLPSVITVGPVDDTSVEAHLGRVVGTPVRLSLQVGAERANAKAVLGVYRVADESEVGFCKVASTPLAGRLVRAESDALHLLATCDLQHLDIPPILHVGRWNERDLLLIGAVRGSRGARLGLPYAAMREVAGVGGVTDVTLRDSPWVASVRSRLDGASTDHAAALRAVLAGLVVRDGDLKVPHGTWHGDWGPWNMAWTTASSGARPVVWDWERCASGVPVGLDAAHFVGHAPLRRIDELPVALAALGGPAQMTVSRLLEPWVAGPLRPATARCVVDAYVLEVACRFAVDAAEVGTAPVARLASWYLQVAARRLDLQADLAGRT